MATRKTAAKKAVKKAIDTSSAPRPKRPAKEQYGESYTMPVSVANWIEYAESTLRWQKTQIAQLKAEVVELKAYKKWAEQRILRSDYE